MEKETNFYKEWSNNLQSREKDKSNLQNEALQLRERCASLLIQLQDLVHPCKWITLAEAGEHIQNERTHLNDTYTNKQTYYTNHELVLEVDLNEIETVIKEADDFLEENQSVNEEINQL